MHLAVTVDTEEDNWGHVRCSSTTVENIRRVTELQRMFDEFGVIPSYLVTYPVAVDETASSILRSILATGRCEIGTQCHPWNTPPLGAGAGTAAESMLCNLPPTLQREKISRLHETIERAFDTRPVSFRCGRWGFHPDIARHLVDVGYRIDTSVTPYMDWTTSDGPDFSNMSPQPFRFEMARVRHQSPPALLEVPVTIGFLQSHFALRNTILRAVQRPPINRLRVAGILYRLGMISKVWLSPELATTAQMIGLTKQMLRQNCRILNLTFHSPSLQAGLTPFVRTRSDERRFFQSVRDYLAFAKDAGIKPIKLSDAPNLV